MYIFRTRGLIFRKTVVTRAGTVQYILMSTCMVHPGSSKCGFATVEAELHFIGQHYMILVRCS